MVSATEELSKFMGRWRGVGAIDFNSRPDKENKPDVKEFWETRGKLVQLRIMIDKVSPFSSTGQKEGLLKEWGKLWAGFHNSGRNLEKDLQFHKEMWQPTENVGSIARGTFMSFRGFLRTTFRW